MNRIHLVFAGLLTAMPVFALSSGCAESTTESRPTGSSSGSSGDNGQSSSSSSSSGSSGQGGGSAGTAKVVINEIQAMGEDWVELVNIGDAVADLSKYGLTDQLDDGTPKVAEAVRFIDGTTLVPGQYLIVVANLSNANPGPQGECLMSGGPDTCYQATWGISGTNGDKIFLLSPTDEVVEEVAYPVNAVLDGQSYCRLPNGIGDFAACSPTPAELNTAP